MAETKKGKAGGRERAKARAARNPNSKQNQEKGTRPAKVDISNPNQVIRAQAAENERTALLNNQMNNANIQGVGVNRNVTFDENGNPTVNVGMGQQEQAAYDRFMQQASQPVDFSQLPAMPGDFSADRQRIEDQLYGREEQRLNEQFGQAEEDFQRQMAAKGIPMGSPLYNKQYDQFQRQKQEAFSGARQNAIQTAGSEQQRLFGNALQGRQQGFTEMDYARTQPFNQFQGLMGLGANLSGNFGQFQGSQMGPTDIGGIASSYYGTNKAAQSAGAGGITQADRIAMMNAEHANKRDLMQFGQELANQNKTKKPGFGDALASAGAGALGGFASGFGSSLGTAWGS